MKDTSHLFQPITAQDEEYEDLNVMLSELNFAAAQCIHSWNDLYNSLGTVVYGYLAMPEEESADRMAAYFAAFLSVLRNYPEEADALKIMVLVNETVILRPDVTGVRWKTNPTVDEQTAFLIDSSRELH